MEAIQSFIAKHGVRKTVLLLLVLAFLQQTIGRRLADRIKGLPPGPIPLPIIGTFYQLSPPNTPPGIHRDYWRLAQIYGPIYTLYYGSNKGVVLNSPELFYEALMTKQDETSYRPVLKSFMNITRGAGVAMTNGERWRAHRTTLQRTVTNKQLGVESAPMIVEEISATLYWLKKQCETGKGADFDFRQLCRRESLNVVMRKIFSFRFDTRLTPAYMETQDWIRIIFEHIAQGSPSDFMPIFALFPDPEAKKFVESCDRMHAFFDVELEKHKREVGKRQGAELDFMDLMLIAQKEDTAAKAKVVMTDLDIKVSAWDMMAGAIDTSATTMEWLIYTLINHKRVLRKVQAVLDDVVGPNRLPTLDDIPQLEYVTAVLDEICRWKHFAPNGLPHEAAEDMTLGGYNIPKGTQLFFNFYSLHHNEKLWKNPGEFRPERFLEEERPLLDTILHPEMYFTKPEAYKFVPFGQGRRRCVGYGIGRIVLWLKTAIWLHCFDWDSANGQPLNLDTEIMGITMVPEQQKIKAIPRPAAKLLVGEEAIKCESR